MGRGPHLEPITAFVARRPGPALVVVGGRNLGAAGDGPVRFTLAVDGRDLETWQVAPDPGFFLRRVALPAGVLDGGSPWAALTLRASPASGTTVVPAAVEQFDVQSPGSLMWAYGEGFHEPELDNVRARSWRWMSERAVVEVPQTSGDVTLAIRGESPLTYFAQPSILEVRVGETLLGRIELRADFTVRLGVFATQLDGAAGRLVLTTTQTFAPSERGNGSDRRRLGLRLFEVTVTPGLPAGSSSENSGQNPSDLR